MNGKEIDKLIDEYKRSRKPLIGEKLYNASEKYILWVVYSIYNKLPHGAVEKDDLLSVAKIAFFESISKYDATKSMQFATYTVSYIKGYLGNYIQDELKYKIVITNSVSYMNPRITKKIKAEAAGLLEIDIIPSLTKHQIQNLKVSELVRNKIMGIWLRTRNNNRDNVLSLDYSYDEYDEDPDSGKLSGLTVIDKKSDSDVICKGIDGSIITNRIINFLRDDMKKPKLAEKIKENLIGGGSTKDCNKIFKRRPAVKMAIRDFLIKENLVAV